MLGLRKIFFIVLILIAAGAALLAVLDRVVVYFIAKNYNLAISYTHHRNEFFKAFAFSDLKVVSKGAGSGFLARRARIRPAWKGIFKGVSGRLDLYDVDLFKDNREVAETYDTLDGLVLVPFAGKWRYHEISAEFAVFEKGVRVNDLIAVSDEIKIRLAGILYSDNKVTSDVVIYFSGKLASRIPQELSGVLLKEEESGWKSLAVSLNGDLKSPAIQVSGRLFRLNIRNPT